MNKVSYNIKTINKHIAYLESLLISRNNTNLETYTGYVSEKIKYNHKNNKIKSLINKLLINKNNLLNT